MMDCCFKDARRKAICAGAFLLDEREPGMDFDASQ
jgi:hypothetical protein